MGMRKAFVFIATFAAVLIAGAAFAFMATPGGDNAATADEVTEKSTTTSTFYEENPEEKEPPKEQPKNSSEDKPQEGPKEDPFKEEKTDKIGPELVILAPKDGTHTTKIELAYEGEVEPGAQLHVGDREVEVDDKGHWRIVLPHELGENRHLFVAIDEAGNKTGASVKVWRDKEEPKEEPKEDPKEEPKEHEFWVKQKYGSCGEAEPYDKWYGEGAPGTEIWIVSEFGEGHTVIGESGEWSLTVFFNPETTPCGDGFGVVLETSEGHRKVFEFIRWCEEGGHEEPPPEEEK